MVYRIRYRRPDASNDREVVVEANSPTEAMVKFQHTRDGGHSSLGREIVTSVRPEDSGYDFGL